MDGTGSEPRLVANRFADAVGPAGDRPDRDRCHCVGHSAATRPEEVAFHADEQDVDSPGWRRLLTLIDDAAADGREVFKPFVEMSAAERRQVVTLPSTIARLTEVKRLVLPYTSHRLHWYPFELTRCTRLRDSTVSTRVLYGNVKFRPPFPRLRAVTTVAEVNVDRLDPGTWGADAVRGCSVCGGPVSQELRQVWISLAVATDVLPMLVNACSAACVAALPPPRPGYVPTPHLGGPDIVQPTTRAW